MAVISHPRHPITWGNVLTIFLLGIGFLTMFLSVVYASSFLRENGTKRETVIVTTVGCGFFTLLGLGIFWLGVIRY